jgi:hypothetical protein
MQDRDAARAQRVMKTMLQMIKLEVARLQQAAKGHRTEQCKLVYHGSAVERDMTVKTLLASAALAAALLTATPAVAHHSANAEFDTQKVMVITGVLTNLEVVSPHSWWHLEVKGPDGNVTTWRLESNSPAGLIRLGVKVKTDVKVGETYSFRISPAWKDPSGEKLGWMRAFTINGKEYVLTEL